MMGRGDRAVPPPDGVRGRVVSTAGPCGQNRLAIGKHARQLETADTPVNRRDHDNKVAETDSGSVPRPGDGASVGGEQVMKRMTAAALLLLGLGTL